MIHSLVPVSAQGGQATDAIDAVRNAQAQLRASAKARGETPSVGSNVETARAIVDATQIGAARLDASTFKPKDVPDVSARDPLLTGPRPTFDKTPLEKMRSDVMQGDAARVDRAPTGDQTAAADESLKMPVPEVDVVAQSAQFGVAAPVASSERPVPSAAYDGTRKIQETRSAGSEMDLFR